MKTWGIIATVLLLAALGGAGWFYMQNSDLKSKNSKLETDLTAANTAKISAEKKISNARSKAEILTVFFNGNMDQAASDRVNEMIKEIDNPTLSADWIAMRNGKPGDSTGDKMMLDLSTATLNDLK